MLRTRTLFPSLATKLVLQVCGSVAATLIASALVAGLPKPDRAAVPAELTSGGKFAARAVAAADEVQPSPVRPALPLLTQVSFEPFPASAPPAADMAQPAVAVLVEPAPRPSRKTRAPVRAEHPHALEPVPAASVPQAAEAARSDEGLLPRVVASAHSAWTFTASAGGSLLSHLVP